MPVDNWEELTQGGHWMGARNAPVVILEFADFECPACGYFTNSILRPFVQQNQGSVAVVFRNWPLSYHRFAYPAARAAECAGKQNKFGQFHDRLYELQDSLGLKSFEAIGVEVGVPNRELFTTCLIQKNSVSRVDQDIEVAQQLGGRGTPTVLVNGYRYQSLPTRQTLDSILDAVVNRSES